MASRQPLTYCLLIICSSRFFCPYYCLKPLFRTSIHEIFYLSTVYLATPDIYEEYIAVYYFGEINAIIISITDILTQLSWRYATKQFDPTKKLSPTQINLVEESLRLAPSSYNLQAWKFIHVINQATRLQLRQAAFDQPQLTDCDQLYVLTIPTSYSASDLNRVINLISSVRNIKKANLAGFKKMLAGYLSSRTPLQTKEWLTRQVYIALGQAMTACALESIDTCPLEGFDPQKFNQILNLDTLGLESVVALAVGFRSPDDKYSQLTKVRFSKEAVFIEV